MPQRKNSAFPVLSIQQPYADLVVTPLIRKRRLPLAEKWAENRTWRTDYRGPLLIHASRPTSAIIGCVLLRDCISYRKPDSRRPKRFDDLETEIVAVVKQHTGLVVKALDDEWESSWRHVESLHSDFGWIFTHPHKFNHPVPCPGRLRLWTPPADVWAEIRPQLPKSVQDALQP